MKDDNIMDIFLYVLMVLFFSFVLQFVIEIIVVVVALYVVEVRYFYLQLLINSVALKYPYFGKHPCCTVKS